MGSASECSDAPRAMAAVECLEILEAESTPCQLSG